MPRTIKIILSCLVLFALFTGFKQISSKNEVFDKALMYCCNAGYCNEAPCSNPSSISLGTAPDCHDYIADCYTCMNLKSSPQYCGGDAGSYCLDGDGNPYYGRER